MRGKPARDESVYMMPVVQCTDIVTVVVIEDSLTTLSFIDSTFTFRSLRQPALYGGAEEKSQVDSFMISLFNA
jgi:hypothetical protein